MSVETTLDELALPRVVLVTGAGATGPELAAATAALAVLLADAGRDVDIAVPVVTADGEGDAEVITRLSGRSAQEWQRLHEALPPVAAAERAGVSLAPAVKHALRAAGTEHDALLLHGAHGLLVPLDARGGTLADVGTALRYKGVSTGIVLVTDLAATALDHVALAAEALGRRDLPVVGVVVTGVGTEGALERAHLQSLPRLAGAPLLALVPAGAADLDAATLSSQAPAWFSPDDWWTMSS